MVVKISKQEVLWWWWWSSSSSSLSSSFLLLKGCQSYELLHYCCVTHSLAHSLTLTNVRSTAQISAGGSCNLNMDVLLGAVS